MQHIIDEYKRQSREAMRECFIRVQFMKNNPDKINDPKFGELQWIQAKHFALLAARVCN